MEALGKQVREILVESSFMKKDPLRLFSLAFQYGWENVGRVAARNTLALQLQDLPHSNELNSISGGDLWYLNQYRYQCSDAIRKWVSKKDALLLGYERGSACDAFVWWNSKNSRHTASNTNNHCSQQSYFYYAPSNPFGANQIFINCDTSTSVWWTTYINSLLRYLEFCPSERTIREDSGYAETALTSAARCSFCAASAYKDLPIYKELLAKTISKVIDEVRVTATSLLVLRLLFIYLMLQIGPTQH